MARPEVEPKTPLGRRLRDVRDQLKIADRGTFAEMLGVSLAALAYYERGERVPDASVLAAYREKFGVNVSWLVTGIGDNIFEDPTKSPSAPITVEETDFRKFANTMVQKIGSLERRLEPPPPPPATVKYFPHAASAGWGLAVSDDERAEDLDIEAFFARLLGINVDYASLFQIKGDSMFPTLRHGDWAILDRLQRKIVDDQVFVFSLEDDLYIKRARTGPDGALNWHSDNEDYQPICLKGDEITRMKVVGRVTNVIRAV